MKSPLAVLVAAVLAASLRVAEPAEAATVSVNINSNIIEVTGVIDRATVSEFTAGATRIRDYYYLDGTMVVLNSEGGDLVAAMEIGQIIRSRSLLTDVGGTARCASACVFILAAGVDRSAYGKIGIHRPHFDDRYFADLTLAQARAKYEQLQTMATRYLREMGMPDDLYIEMMRIPSDGIRWLSPEESYKLGLDGLDPAYEEWLRAQYAQQFGADGYQRHISGWKLLNQCGTVRRCREDIIERYPEALWTPDRR